jgi:hypothetical protein
MNVYIGDTPEQLGSYQTADAFIVGDKVVTKTDYLALVAQVEVLRKSDGKLRALCDELIDHLRYNKAERTNVLDGFWAKLESIELPATSTQYLCEIQATYFEKGFIQGVKFIGSGFVSESDYEEAKAYGDDIRQGGE